MSTVAAPRPRVAVVAYTEYAWDPRVRRQAEMLAEAGYAVHAIVLRSRAGEPRSHVGPVHVHGVPLTARRGTLAAYAYRYTMFFLLGALELVRLRLRGPLDLVHVHTLPDFLVFCAAPMKLRRVPVLLDLHEAMPEILAARFRAPPGSRLFRLASLVEQLSCRFADHVVAANDGIRQAVTSRGVARERVTTIYNPGDPGRPKVSPESLRVALGLPNGRLIVHAGGVNPERDLETLIAAVAMLPSDATAHLVIAGDGEPAYLGALRQLSERLGISDRVRFVGRLSRDDAQALMALSSVGIVTLSSNPLTELAWPNRILEFASLGKPLVVPRLRFLASVLEGDARYYAPGDRESLARQLDDAIRVGSDEGTERASKELSRRFDPARMRGILLDVYRSLEGSHGA